LLWGSCVCLLLTMHSSCGIILFSLLALLIYLASLRGYVVRDHKDLSIRDLEHVTRVVGGDVRTMCGSRTGGWSLPCVMSD
jgi:hypothetical protein